MTGPEMPDGFSAPTRRSPSTFFVLVAVGVLWGVPLLFAGSATTDPGLAAHPRLAGVLEPLAIPLLLTAIVLAIAGTGVVGAWSRRRRQAGEPLAPWRVLLGVAGLTVLLWLAAVVLAAGSYPYSAFIVWAAGVYAFGAVVVFVLMLGLVVTVTVFWRQRRWPVALWLMTWVPLSAIVVLGSQQSAAADKDFKGALFVFGGGALLVLVAAIAALVVVGLDRIPHEADDRGAAEVTRG
jgi:hypothetical protein